ncbi:MAG: hypothetical protein C4586_08365 [Anaerolineaceae bacterium]|nr:MAG: hypothetical protein C4586_08365 [Anaerolineaceae bacterium]
MMTLKDDQRKLLSRIMVDSPNRGDGQKLVELLDAMEIDSLKQSRAAIENVTSRWLQGESLGYLYLKKQFIESRNS